MLHASNVLSILTLVISSSVVSALVNVLWNWYVKREERKRDAAREAHKVGHVYLNVVIQLERFVRKCQARRYAISEGLDKYRRHEMDAFDGIGGIQFAFEPAPDWTALPIPFVAKVNTLGDRFEQCDVWITEQWNYWADIDDAYEFEYQRVSYYALEACKLSKELRALIGAGLGDIGALHSSMKDSVDSSIKKCRERPEAANVIPEITSLAEEGSKSIPSVLTRFRNWISSRA